jgi:hypothetical protein
VPITVGSTVGDVVLNVKGNLHQQRACTPGDSDYAYSVASVPEAFGSKEGNRGEDDGLGDAGADEGGDGSTRYRGSLE